MITEQTVLCEEKKPNQWNMRHFGLLESEIIADHEETGVVTIRWMSESEPRDGQRSKDPVNSPQVISP